MNKILFLAAGLACSAAMTITSYAAEVPVTSKGATCWQLNSYTGDKQSTSATYFALLDLNSTPEVTITCQNLSDRASHKYINNMQINGQWFNFYTAVEGLSPQFIIEVEEGYAVEGIKATLKTVNGGKAVEWTVKDKTYTTTTEGVTVEISGLNLRRLSLIPNTADPSSVVPTLWEDFTVNVIESEKTDDDVDYEDDLTFTVFDNSTSSVPYRIPAIARNFDGDLVAVADYRYSGQDIGVATNGKLDLRFRIRDAKTGIWGDVQTLKAAFGEGNKNVAFGDPCIVGDRESNRMMVTSCCGNVSFPNGTHANHQGWARFYSEDGGKTWSDYEDISDQVFSQLDKKKNGQIRCFFIGSGKISQSSRIKVGDYYRLYCAALVKDNAGTNCNYVFYSDDFGLNWHLLGDVDDCPVPSGADEPKAEELPDGSVLVSSRISGGRYFNVFHYSDVEAGTGTWDSRAISNEKNNGIVASSNACNGEVMVLPVIRNSDGEKMHVLLQSVPFGPTARTNVGINYKVLRDERDYSTSRDLAEDWDGAYTVSYTTSGYSTMCLDKDNNIAFLMEENQYGSGYDIVYVNIKMEEITGGDFSIDKEALSSGVENIESDDFDSDVPVVYYDLQGRRVANPSGGIFIRKQGARASKVIIK